MTVNTNKTQYTSEFDGFKNSPKVTFSRSLDSVYGFPEGTAINVTPGSYLGPVRATHALSNNNSISQIQVQLSGIESFYRVLNGVFQKDFPTQVGRTYSIEVFSYFQGGNVVVDAYAINQIGSTVSIPPFVLSCEATPFVAPF